MLALLDGSCVEAEDWMIKMQRIYLFIFFIRVVSSHFFFKCVLTFLKEMC